MDVPSCFKSYPPASPSQGTCRYPIPFLGGAHSGGMPFANQRQLFEIIYRSYYRFRFTSKTRPEHEAAMSPTLRLPTLRVAAQQAEIELTAKPSLNIDLPDNAQPIATIEDLLSAVRHDHLWITREGACCIEVSIAVNGRPILESSRLESIIEAISNCEVPKLPLLTARLFTDSII